MYDRQHIAWPIAAIQLRSVHRQGLNFRDLFGKVGRVIHRSWKLRNRRLPRQ